MAIRTLSNNTNNMVRLLLLLLIFSSCISRKPTTTPPIRVDTIIDVIIDTITIEKTDTFVETNNVYIHDTVRIPCDTTTPPIILSEIMRPKTFKEFVGVNASLTTDKAMRKAYAFENQRVFYLIDHDLHGVPLVDRFPEASTAKCPNINNGWEKGNAAWVYRMCEYTKHFKTISLDLETIYYPDGKGGIKEKRYPNKSLSLEDMGGKPFEYGKRYGTLLNTSMSQFVGSTELYIAVANEPHGSPSYSVMQKWSQGMHEGLKGSGIKLVSQDVQATGDDVFNSQVLNNNVANIDTSIFDVLQTHSYTFDDNFRLTLPPEISTTKWMSPLREIKDMSKTYGSKKQLWLTEFGYDSEALGEVTQSAYIQRTIFLAMRWGFDKGFVYSIIDEPVLPFKYCGLLNEDASPKRSYKDLVGIVTKYGDYYFDKVLTESKGNYEYIFTNGIDNINVIWNIDDTTPPKIIKYDK